MESVFEAPRGRQLVQAPKEVVETTEVVERKPELLNADYEHRQLNFCHFCGNKYNVGNRIPRIIVGCGHTFCTSCLSYFLREGRIRCPICRKLLKGVESVDKLPLNFNILYEVVTKDPLLSNVNFDRCLQADLDESEDPDFATKVAPYLCQQHDQRIKHFYCSEHPSIFCRECIKDLHYMDECFVVDLYEIEKMRVLQEKNTEANQMQLGKRVDGASQVYVEHSKPLSPLSKPDLLELLYKGYPTPQGARPQGTAAKNFSLQRPTTSKAKFETASLGSSYGEEIAEDLSSSEEVEYGSDQPQEIKANETGLTRAEKLAMKKGQEEFTQEEMFQMNKKLFAEQMRQELLGGAPVAKEQRGVIQGETYDDDYYDSQDSQEMIRKDDEDYSDGKAEIVKDL